MKKTILFLCLILCSCIVPKQEEFRSFFVSNSNAEPNTSIEAVWERVRGAQMGFVYFSKEEDSLWIEAFVSSSDASGNFYKEIYIQDRPKSPEFAARFLIDQTFLSNDYPVGQKINILLNGLGAGLQNGVVTLGAY